MLVLVAMGLAFASCKQDDADVTTFYTVTFDSKGGTEVTSQRIERGKQAKKPAIPAWQGTGTFLFDNWYTSTLS